MLMQANLIVRSLDNSTELPVGKVVEYQSRHIVHCYVYGKYMRHSTAAWGVRYPLAGWMDRQGISDLYLWDNKAKVTYCIDLDTVRQLGTPGVHDRFGGTLNVPKDEWQTLDHQLKVAWVPEDHKVVLPQCSEPWPLPARETAPLPKRSQTSGRKKKPEPAGVQGSLF